MILTTTNNIENFQIVDYLGIVTGSAYDSSYSTNGKKMSFTDMFSMTKYREMYTLGLEGIKEKAFQNLKENAVKIRCKCSCRNSNRCRTFGKFLYTFSFYYRNCSKSKIN